MNRTQRYLVWIGFVGVLTSCFGCSLLISNQSSQLMAARVFLIAAQVILIPLFVYVIILRNRAAAQYKRRQERRAARQQRELETLASVSKLLAEEGLESPPIPERKE